MEEIEKMLDENGKFNINDIQILLDELVYNFDMDEEYESDLKQSKEDRNTYAKMYNEYNRKLPECAKIIRETKEKIAKLDEKQQRLNGRISKVDAENRISYQSILENLEKEYQELINNRNEAKIGFKEADENYQQLLETNKGVTSKEEFKSYESKLQNIGKYCMMKMQEADNRLENASQKFDNAVTVDEKLEAAISLKEAVDNKNKFYYDYEKIVNYINNSSEYKSTVSEHLIDDLKEEFQKQINNELEKNEMVAEPLMIEKTNDTNLIEKQENFQNSSLSEEVKSMGDVLKEETIEEKVNDSDNTMTFDYWKMQYPKIEEVKPYAKDMSNPMTLEELSKEESIFKDEERINKDHNFMPYQNTQNLNFANEENFISSEEDKEKVPTEEKSGFFQKIKDKINKDLKDSEEIMVDDDLYEEENQEAHNIVNVDYVKESLIDKISYKMAKFFLTEDAFNEWCTEKNVSSEVKII